MVQVNGPKEDMGIPKLLYAFLLEFPQIRNFYMLMGDSINLWHIQKLLSNYTKLKYQGEISVK